MAGILKVDRVQSDSNLAFQIGSSNVAYFNTDGINMTGNQIITGNGILRTTSGMLYANNGIAFPASQSSSADPNVLDDYEEGTFTPVFAGSSSNPSVTYSAQDGRYTKIGNRVYFSILLIITGVSSQGTGNILINGLPFSAAGSSYENVCPIGYNDVFDTAFKTAYVSTSTMLIIPVGVTQGNSIYGSALDNRSNLSTGYLGISGSYRV